VASPWASPACTGMMLNSRLPGWTVKRGALQMRQPRGVIPPIPIAISSKTPTTMLSGADSIYINLCIYMCIYIYIYGYVMLIASVTLYSSLVPLTVSVN